MRLVNARGEFFQRQTGQNLSLDCRELFLCARAVLELHGHHVRGRCGARHVLEVYKALKLVPADETGARQQVPCLTGIGGLTAVRAGSPESSARWGLVDHRTRCARSPPGLP